MLLSSLEESLFFIVEGIIMLISFTDLGGGLFEVESPPLTTQQYLDGLRRLKSDVAEGCSLPEIDSQIALTEKRLALEKQIDALQKELEATYQ